MILTKKDIQKFSESMHCFITPAQEALILEQFGTEPDDIHEWSEQDIAEQIRKIITKSEILAC